MSQQGFFDFLIVPAGSDARKLKTDQKDRGQFRNFGEFNTQRKKIVINIKCNFLFLDFFPSFLNDFETFFFSNTSDLQRRNIVGNYMTRLPFIITSAD